MKVLFKQAISFFVVSGAGWVIDFSVFIFLTTIFGFNVGKANFISAVPAVTFVFFISTRKIFENRCEGFGLYKKYFLYLVYQILLIYVMSLFAQWLYEYFSRQVWIKTVGFFSYLKLICKILITPITMILNFIVMKLLTGKL